MAQWSGSWHIQPPAASRRLPPPPPLRPISRGHTPPLAHKVGQTQPWTQFSLSQFLISHLFLGSNPTETKHSAQISPYKKNIFIKKRKEKKKFGRRRSVVGPLQVRPCGAFGPARCCVVAAPELSSQSWDQSAETARCISLRGATWLVPRSKKKNNKKKSGGWWVGDWIWPWDVRLFLVGEQLLELEWWTAQGVCSRLQRETNYNLPLIHWAQLLWFNGFNGPVFCQTASTLPKFFYP